MAKKDKAVYAPGELSRVREKLGVFDKDEARVLAEKLGGEIGYERTDDEERAKASPQRRTRNERVDVKIGSQPSRRVELPPEPEAETGSYRKKRSKRKKENDPADDPSVTLKASYWDRIKMDRFAAQPEYEIKSPGQVFHSMISVFADITDYVNPVFVNTRMTEYYKKIELLVVSTRNMLPKNNARRGEIMKKNAPLAYLILDTIRSWDIERISSDLARFQARPRSVKVSDFADILKAVYRPLFILGLLDLDTHIRPTYKVLYKLLFIENPQEAQSKFQDLIRTALSAYTGVSRDVHQLLYPLLMKTVSAKYLPYEIFFAERKKRIMAFLGVTSENQLFPMEVTMQENIEELESGEEAPKGEGAAQGEAGGSAGEEPKLSEEEKARRAAEATEKRALDRGLQTLEALFPKAGWNNLSSYPDLYPYFVDVLDLRRGVVNIAPGDPMLQIFILMRILEELFFGLRYVSFGSVRNSAGNLEKIDASIMDIINDWHYFIKEGFGKEYLPRMAEYVRILEGSPEERSSNYTKKLVAELHWTKRLYFLPFYKFETLVAPPFQKGEIIKVYSRIKSLRKYLTSVAAGIEMGNRAGGAEARAACEGIVNPWEPYAFQIPNPLSIRLDALLPPKARNNASLIYFCLAVTAVLDHLVNNENSWAYSPRQLFLFRSINGDGVMPLTGVDERIDADALFRQSLKQRQKQ